MLNFDFKKRINLEELNKKIEKIDIIEDNYYTLQNIINDRIENYVKTKEEFSSFEINDFLKQLINKEAIISNYISINEIIPKNILYFN